MTPPASAPGIADEVAAAGWAALLPAHRADGDDQPEGPPRCVSVTRLGGDLALAIVLDAGDRVYPAPVVLTDGAVRRAVPGDGAAEAVLALLAAGNDHAGDLQVTAWHGNRAEGERAVEVDQTNESVIVGDRAVVKWTFHADGAHPAPSLLAELDGAGFTGMPRPWGVVQWRPRTGSPHLIALATEYIDGAADGWTWFVEDLVRAVAFDDTIATSTGTAVGELVAAFHRALTQTARSASSDEAEAWRTGALADLDRALALTRGAARDILHRHATRVRAAFQAMPTSGDLVMRVHGDLHVGQVLRTGEDAGATYLLTDFDGNPVVEPDDRVREQPAALDVAGMAQSMVHAGLVVRRHHPALDADTVDRVARAARSAFLTSYRAGLGDRDGLLDERLLTPLALRQVCREFIYAATHLPRWSYVPEAALSMLLEESAS